MSQLFARGGHWSFSFSIIPSKEIPGLIYYRNGEFLTDFIDTSVLGEENVLLRSALCDKGPSSQGYGFSSSHVCV